MQCCGGMATKVVADRLVSLNILYKDVSSRKKSNGTLLKVERCRATPCHSSGPNSGAGVQCISNLIHSQRHSTQRPAPRPSRYATPPCQPAVCAPPFSLSPIPPCPPPPPPLPR
ncbi:hypothetical protein E2C01_009801 [Portunus trituberculatus]|uniref:Uncharacterized protein n=1 Tax=Portunus trituberculatus TaxID=210409 RepID=A0A5B7D6Q4_PORTR|nr:hypothetical protein [Portunus trituberculatus]